MEERSQVPAADGDAVLSPAATAELPSLLVELVDRRLDVAHAPLLDRVPPGRPQALLAALEALAAYLEGLDGSPRLLRGMRAARIMADLYAALERDPDVWQHHQPPPCCIDGERIAAIKQSRQAGKLPEAYQGRINELQRQDLRLSLASLTASGAPAMAPRLDPEDFGRTFVVRAPLRLGISSANASDNHLRSKEQGAKTLNAGIALRPAGAADPGPPLEVTARRLGQPGLRLRSMSMDFQAELLLQPGGDAAADTARYFAYRRGGDEALRLVKQALVHTGIVRDDSPDVVGDIAAFAGGGGLEVTTRSRVLQGSGLGTSSILAAAILKALYRLCRHAYGTAEHEYPALYDQSLLLEQSIGLNSGWQDARGACGGPSAVKDFYAPPTDGLPAPARTFLTQVDPRVFTDRVVLFDTGIARGATRGLNVVLDAYLSRDPARFAAIRQSMEIHDAMVQSLVASDYEALGEMATRYWRMRCTLDPGATSPSLQQLFASDRLVEVSTGGLITGAGGGGFALLVARRGRGDELRSRLGELTADPAFARSRVVPYELDSRGVQLLEQD